MLYGFSVDGSIDFSKKRFNGGSVNIFWAELHILKPIRFSFFIPDEKLVSFWVFVILFLAIHNCLHLTYFKLVFH